MKTHLKKLLTLCLVLAMVLSVVGCAAGTSSTTAETASAENGSSAADSAQSSEKLEPLTLKFVVLGGGDSDGNKLMYEKLNEKLKEKLNVTLDISCISWSTWTDEYPLLFASGEQVDLVYVASWADFSGHAAKGAFAELTPEMIQQYAPDAWKAFSEDQWDQCKVNGSIYMIPMPVLMKKSMDYVLVRGDLREKYNLGEIKTADDLLNYWSVVAKNETGIMPLGASNGNGDGEFGTWVTKATTEDPYRSKNYFTPDAYKDVVIDVSDPTNIHMVDDSAYLKERYEAAQTYLKNGYYTQDALSKAEGNDVDFMAGTAATAIGSQGNVGNWWITANKEHPEWKVEVVDLHPDLPKLAGACTSNGMAIGANTSDVSRCLQVLDLLTYDKEFQDMMNLGVEGVHWEAVGDNGFKTLDVDTNMVYDSIAGGVGNENLMRSNVDTYPGGQELSDNYRAKLYTTFAEGVVFDSSDVKNEVAAVAAVDAKYRPILELGFSTDIDADMAAWASERKAAGFDKVMDAYIAQLQAAYDSLNG